MFSILAATTAIVAPAVTQDCGLEDWPSADNIQYERHISRGGISADIPTGFSIEALGQGFYVPSQCGPDGLWMSAVIHDDPDYGELTTEASFLSFMIDRISLTVDDSGKSSAEYLGGELILKNGLICVRSKFRAA